jgi:hypothetical protein
VATGAALASAAGLLLAAPPASATHLTSVTLSSATVSWGTPVTVLSGVVKSTCSTGAPYGWDLNSSVGVMSPTSQAYGGPEFTAYTVTVATGSLPPGVYPVTVSGSWNGDNVNCFVDSSPSVTATITVTGRAGAFACRAVAGRLGSGHFGEANPGLTPCQDDSKYSTTLPIGTLATLGLADSETDQTPDNLNSALPAPGDSAKAGASAATVFVRVGPVRIGVSAVSSEAEAHCSIFLTPTASSGSQVVGLRINGGPARTLTGHVLISVLGVRIEVNKTTIVGTTRTQQALVVSSIYTPGKLVIGEATAGWSGNPCAV